MTAHPTDHFSRQAAEYARHRPAYPPSLFERLGALFGSTAMVWDCATGNGQAAVGLAPHVRFVVATDLSAAQLIESVPHVRVAYAAGTAEAPPLRTGAVDAVTVAQALHWFRHDEFYAAVRRVVRPGGTIAAWAYTLHESGDSRLDQIFRRYYADVVGPYWPPERRHFDTAYRSIPWPFAAARDERFALSVDWSLDAVWGYYGSWSATQRYLADRHTDPREEIREELTAAWGDPAQPRRLHFPIFLRLGTV